VAAPPIGQAALPGERVAAKRLKISAKTADRSLAPERRRLRLDQRRGGSMHRLLWEQIPVKVAEEWDRCHVGNLQVDLVAHCGQSTAGRILCTVSTVDIATNEWEGEPVTRLGSETRRGAKCTAARMCQPHHVSACWHRASSARRRGRAWNSVTRA
jgi:hypothetical protein